MSYHGADTSKMSEKDREAHWKAESDCRTLAEAAAIMSDKPRHRRAVEMAKQKMAELSKVTKEKA